MKLNKTNHQVTKVIDIETNFPTIKSVSKRIQGRVGFPVLHSLGKNTKYYLFVFRKHSAVTLTGPISGEPPQLLDKQFTETHSGVYVDIICVFFSQQVYIIENIT